MRPGRDWPRTDFLTHRTRASPDRLAVLPGDADHAWTYDDLESEVATLHGRLMAAGITPGDHIGAYLEPSVAFVRLLHASIRSGAVLVPLQPGLPPAELEAQIDRADIETVFYGPGTASTACALDVDAQYQLGDTPPKIGEPLRALDPEPMDPPPWRPEQVCLLVFTSGTTGDPMPVQLTPGNLLASATAAAWRLGVHPDDRWLICLPMAHMGGLMPVIRATIYGTSIVIQDTFEPGTTRHLIQEHSITGVSLVPTMLARLLDDGWAPPRAFRCALLGGAPAPADLIERSLANEIPVHPTYGLTETASQVATARPGELHEHPTTVGSPLQWTDVTVVDDGPCPPGDVGELVVSGPTVTPGYYAAPDETAAAFSEHGFHTGDRGYQDQAGRLWILGRTDDMIITGGENVAPTEVTTVLKTHPDVADAAVVGLPDDDWGERVAALVVPTDGYSTSPDELIDYCCDRLAAYKSPKTLQFATAIPRTASGTVDRQAVRTELT